MSLEPDGNFICEVFTPPRPPRSLGVATFLLAWLRIAEIILLRSSLKLSLAAGAGRAWTGCGLSGVRGPLLGPRPVPPRPSKALLRRSSVEVPLLREDSAVFSDCDVEGFDCVD